MENFLIAIEHDPVANAWRADFYYGQSVVLSATNYHDAVLEADMLIPDNHVLGYN